MKLVDVFKEFVLLPNRSERGMSGWVSPENVKKMRLAARNTATVPISNYVLSVYSMPDTFQTFDNNSELLLKHVRLRAVGASRAVGQATRERPCVLATNLTSSPFFTLTVDGKKVPNDAIRSQGGLVSIPAGEGGHQMEVELGTWVTKLLAHSTFALILLFWASLVLLIVRNGLTPDPQQ